LNTAPTTRAETAEGPNSKPTSPVYDAPVLRSESKAKSLTSVAEASPRQAPNSGREDNDRKRVATAELAPAFDEKIVRMDPDFIG